ncbi:MAG: FtsQ-type POTRA domain-containing protein [Ruminococcaceae bacterium]|nr:FtsQ-type POTRA domain-containing protein [Oscillospiraceae bacterium]
MERPKSKQTPRRSHSVSKKRPNAAALRTVLLIGLTVALCVLAAVSVFFAVRRFMKVRTVQVVGISQYEPEDLIGASGIKIGDALYAVEESAVEERMLKSCPYLESVRIEQKFPNKLRIIVTEKAPRWYLEISGSKYALDNDLVVLTQTAKTDGMTKLVLPDVKSVLYGQLPTFGDSETTVRKTLEVISAIRQSPFRDRLTEVDLASRWDIRMVVDGRFSVSMGDMTDFEAKLKAVEEILDSDRLSGCVGGEVDVSVPDNIAVRPIYAEERLPDGK